MKHYVIIGGRLQDDKHDKSLITTMQGNNINEVVLTVTKLFQLVCSQFSNDSYVLEGSDRIMRIINRISDDNISYLEIKEITM